MQKELGRLVKRLPCASQNGTPVVIAYSWLFHLIFSGRDDNQPLKSWKQNCRQGLTTLTEILILSGHDDNWQLKSTQPRKGRSWTWTLLILERMQSPCYHLKAFQKHWRYISDTKNRIAQTLSLISNQNLLGQDLHLPHHYARELKTHWVCLTCFFSSGLWDMRFATYYRKSFRTPKALGFHLSISWVSMRLKSPQALLRTLLTRYSLKPWILETALQERLLLNHT